MNSFNCIGHILVSAIRNLFNNQPDVLKFTSQTKIDEMVAELYGVSQTKEDK